MLGKHFPGLKADLIVVHTEIGCVWMRNVNCDQRNARSRDDVGDRRRHLFLDLKLDDEVYAFGDKFVCILDRGVRVVTIVSYDEFNAGGRSCLLKAARHRLREWHFRALSGEPESHLLRP